MMMLYDYLKVLVSDALKNISLSDTLKNTLLSDMLKNIWAPNKKQHSGIAKIDSSEDFFLKNKASSRTLGPVI